MRKELIELKKENEIDFLKNMLFSCPLKKEEEDYFFNSVKTFKINQKEILEIFKEAIQDYLSNQIILEAKEFEAMLNFFHKNIEVYQIKNEELMKHFYQTFYKSWSEDNVILMTEFYFNQLQNNEDKDNIISYCLRNLDFKWEKLPSFYYQATLSTSTYIDFLQKALDNLYLAQYSYKLYEQVFAQLKLDNNSSVLELDLDFFKDLIHQYGFYSHQNGYDPKEDINDDIVLTYQSITQKFQTCSQQHQYQDLQLSLEDIYNEIENLIVKSIKTNNPSLFDLGHTLATQTQQILKTLNGDSSTFNSQLEIIDVSENPTFTEKDLIIFDKFMINKKINPVLNQDTKKIQFKI